jgi:thiamine transport system permease protein
MTKSVGIRPVGYKSDRRQFWLWLLPVGFLLLFFFYPLVEVLSVSLARGTSDLFYHVSWGNISGVIIFTIWQAVLSTLLTFLIGIPGAYLFTKFNFRGRKLLQLVTNLPFILPTVVVAAGFNALIGPRGWLNLALEALLHTSEPPINLLGTLGAILLAHVFYNLTIVLRLVGGSWAGLNPRPGLAARTLGATPFREFTEITLPLLRPAILSAGLLVFLFDFTSFGVILLLGGAGFSTLEVEIYTQALHLLNLPMAALLTLIQFGFTLLISILYKKVSVRQVPLVPVNERLAARRPTRLSERLFAAITVLLLVLLVVSPLLALAARSFIRLDADRGQRGAVQTGFTLEYYQALFQNPRQSIFYVPPADAINNSIRYGLSTAILSLVLGLLAAYGLRQRSRPARWMDVVFMLPLGASAVTMGLGLLLAFSRPNLNWTASPWMIPAAHTLVALPFVLRSLTPALNAIPEHYRQSAAVLGAAPFQIFLRVDLPLIRRAILSSIIFSFTISLGEFGATTFLARPDFPTIPIAIYRYLSQPGGLNYGQAMAMATILLAVCTIGIAVIERLKLPGEELF